MYNVNISNENYIHTYVKVYMYMETNTHESTKCKREFILIKLGKKLMDEFEGYKFK